MGCSANAPGSEGPQQVHLHACLRRPAHGRHLQHKLVLHAAAAAAVVGICRATLILLRRFAGLPGSMRLGLIDRYAYEINSACRVNSCLLRLCGHDRQCTC